MSALLKLLTNVSWNFLGKCFQQAVFFLISILIARYLGKENLGLYASLLMIPAFVRLINALGLEAVLNKKIPELDVRDLSGQESRYLTRGLLAVRLLSSLVLASVTYWLIPVYAEWLSIPWITPYRLVLSLYFLAVANNALLGVLFMTTLRYKVVSLAEGMNALLNLIFLFICIWQDWKILGVLYSYILATVLQLAVYLYIAAPNLRGEARKTPLKEVYSLALVSYGIQILNIGLWAPSDVFFMNYFHVEAEKIGFYHLATSLGTMMIFALAGVGQIAQSLLAEAHAKEGDRGLSRVWEWVLKVSIVWVVPVAIFSLVYAEGFLDLLYGEAYRPAALALKIYLVSVLLFTLLGGDLNIFALYVLQKRRLAFFISLEGSLINIVLDWFLIPLYQERGATLATGFAMVYIAFRQLWALRQKIANVKLIKTLSQTFIVCIVALIPGRLFFGEFAVIESALLYGVILLAVLFQLKPLGREPYEMIVKKMPKLSGLLQRFCQDPGR